MDLKPFSTEVGPDGDVTIEGSGSRGGGVEGVRRVSPPTGIDWIQPDEMTVCCGAGTPVDELAVALAEVGQRTVLPAGGTVGGALAVGHSDLHRLGFGPVRDAVLRVRYVNDQGDVVTAGGPTVKNVSGFDLCRLLVGSRGTLGFLGEVILRTRPLPAASGWFRSTIDPEHLLVGLYRPVSLLWDGETSWVLLEGHPADLAAQAQRFDLVEADGPPDLPRGGRWSIPPSAVSDLSGTFVAEYGVGVVHHHDRPPVGTVDPAVRSLHVEIKRRFDPRNRLNPGVDVLEAAI